ncbi:hypothetical protein L1077_07420 [Pseudoalteromonas luteoviolacea]|uniref:hypothetical protein n=1 Tax=Pseudoalteromonas luteoviolacea TaxID=43657 RepID=UPI001F2C4E07|nr:hypothetical protein [Pseudoalteromonas luteoviolacea]MCF6439254.1 hypothetical protein [Pseudoalteromonas luteoviolacea]
MKKNVHISAPFLLLVILYLLGLFGSALPFEVIDRDKSGIVSALELLDSFDTGVRYKEGCKEYYWFKDGLTAYRVCE